MFWKKKTKEEKPFDEVAWKEFVRYIAVQKFANGDKEHQFSPDRIFISYDYIGQKYEYLKYTIKKENGVPLFVSFWLPKTEENSWMDCRLINRCKTTEEAIRYIADLQLSKKIDSHEGSPN